MTEDLTDAERETVRAIVEYRDLVGEPPTLSELADKLGLAGKSCAAWRVRRLEDKGVVRRERHHARSLQVVEDVE